MLQTLVPLAAEGEEHSVLLPALPEVIWSVIILAVLFIVMMRVMYPTYLKLVDERAQKIKDGLELAEQAKKQVADADAKAAKELAAALEEASQIRAEAQTMAKQIVSAAKNEAQEEADRIITGAQRQIEAQRQAAEISLRVEVGLLAADLAEKIVGEQLKDRELSARVVDRYLDQLEASAKESVAN